MQRIGKRALWVVGGLLAGLVIIVVGGFLWLRGSLPGSGAVAGLDGLSGPAEVLRDEHGVPHIFAQSIDDALFATGYAHAQDRLWQMESMRRLGAGRLAEVIGSPGLRSDRFMRTLGVYRRAERQYASLPDDVRRAFEAYAAGVNAWLGDRPGPLPPEFLVLGIDPEPWRPADSLVWIKIMALRLATNHRKELLRAHFSDFLTPQQVDELWPPYPAGAPLTTGDPAGVGRGMNFEDILAGQPGWQRGARSASNVWAVAGELTTTEKPLLANDPHLGFSAPILWYLLSIRTPDLHFSGASSPGFPFPILGHNQRVAWGMTSTGSDIEDLFVEIVDPENPGLYFTANGPRPFDTRVETIEVKDADDVDLTVRETRHGPVISDLPERTGKVPASMAGADPTGERVLALAATYLQDDDDTPEAAFRLFRSESWPRFVDALERFHAPQLNFVYADVAGNIGFLAPGRVPVRGSDLRGLPSVRWDGAADWTGYVAFDDLPQAYNPASGRLLNANEDITPEDYLWYLGDSWDPGYRARRIADMLSGEDPQSPDTMSAMLMDNVSLMARHLLPMMLEQLPDRERFGDVVPLLRDWSGEMYRDRPEPLIFAAWLRAFNRAVYSDELGNMWQRYWHQRPRFIATVLEEKSHWCDDVDTGPSEPCAAPLEASLAEALAALSSEFGEGVKDWRWGDVHKARFAHSLFTHVPVLNKFVDLEIESNGGYYTVNRGAHFVWDPVRPFAHVHGAGFRAVYDLAELGKSRFVIATGQSGNPLSKHYGDMLERWRDGGWIQLGQTREELERSAENRLVLEP